ncbi:NUDIX hydrolase [Edaphobacter albus]|uniref:NUDIX hydrolase n=1 Tax=Edaphobacter sp. 4G125 TaxID=2763071 RepID=UPI001C99A1C1|nr:NUDIX domain-containing protein [Edaphobacter sp. 4G125]
MRSGREYPQAPIVGVAAVVVCGETILLVRRGREPMRGTWSLPGGALELGETTAEGIVREVCEEAGVQVRPVEVITALDRIIRDEAGRVRFHYVLVEWLCLVEEKILPELLCGDDAIEARWIPYNEASLAEYDLGTDTLDVIEQGWKLAETKAR